MTTARKPLAEYLTSAYPFTTVADDAGYFVSFPDLPGCMTQVERLEHVGVMAAEILKLWLETAYEQGLEIPEPSAPSHYSGKFVVRLPRSLHRRLAESAAQEGVSLNQYATTLLAAGDAVAAVQVRLDRVEQEIHLAQDQLRTTFRGSSSAPEQSTPRVVGIKRPTAGGDGPPRAGTGL